MFDIWFQVPFIHLIFFHLNKHHPQKSTKLTWNTFFMVVMSIKNDLSYTQRVNLSSNKPPRQAVEE